MLKRTPGTLSIHSENDLITFEIEHVLIDI
jgi:hypothetical protein